MLRFAMRVALGLFAAALAAGVPRASADEGAAYVAHLLPLPEGQAPIAGLNWAVKDFRVEPQASGAKVRPLVEVKFEFAQAAWMLYVGAIKLKDAKNPAKTFSLFVPLKGPETRVLVTSFDDKKKRVTELRTISFPDWDRFQADLAPPPQAQSAFEVRAALGGAFHLYTETFGGLTIPAVGDILAPQLDAEARYFLGAKPTDTDFELDAFGGATYHLPLAGVSFPLHGEAGLRAGLRNVFTLFDVSGSPFLGARAMAYSEPGYDGSNYVTRNNLIAFADLGLRLTFTVADIPFEITPYGSFGYGRSNLGDGTQGFAMIGVLGGGRVVMLFDSTFFAQAESHYGAFWDSAGDGLLDFGVSAGFGARLGF